MNFALGRSHDAGLDVDRLTSASITSMFSYFPRIPRTAPQYQRRKSGGGDLVKKRLKEMIVRRSMTVHQTASLPRCLAASKPPNPAPMIRTRGAMVFEVSIVQ